MSMPSRGKSCWVSSCNIYNRGFNTRVVMVEENERILVPISEPLLTERDYFPFISLSMARAPRPSIIVSTPATRNVYPFAR